LDWDALGSSYSTSFSEYSGDGYELSDGENSAEHRHPDRDVLLDMHPHRHVLSGQMRSAEGLPSPGERSSSAGRAAPKGSGRRVGSSPGPRTKGSA
jgi:hypothetical protein